LSLLALGLAVGAPVVASVVAPPLRAERSLETGVDVNMVRTDQAALAGFAS